MKKFIFMIFMLLLAKATFAQLNADGSPNDVLVISLGLHQTFMNNGAFDAWTLSNFNKKLNQDINAEGDLSYFWKKYDAGVHLSSSASFVFGNLYFGTKLTPTHSSVSSYLNLDLGLLGFSRHDIVPVDYTPTPDQQGKDLKLKYSMPYLGLTSMNYLNNLHFRFGKHNKTSFNTGFYVTAGYDVFNARKWKYGYDDKANETIDADGAASVPFKSVTLHNIPLFNQFFVEAGIFVGIGN
jgi:hypothetical protein